MMKASAEQLLENQSKLSLFESKNKHMDKRTPFQLINNRLGTHRTNIPKMHADDKTTSSVQLVDNRTALPHSSKFKSNSTKATSQLLTLKPMQLVKHSVPVILERNHLGGYLAKRLRKTIDSEKLMPMQQQWLTTESQRRNQFVEQTRLNYEKKVEHMSIANKAIDATKQDLAFGAGNIIEDVSNTDTESLGRADHARDLYSEVNKKNFTDLDKIMLRAAAAKIAMGGNCHEHAAIAFAHLMSSTKGVHIQICKIQMELNPDDQHVFVRILGDQWSIVVDAWGSNCNAELLKNSKYKDRQNEIDVIHETMTTGTDELLKKSKAALKQTKVYQSKLEDIEQYKNFESKPAQTLSDSSDDEDIEPPKHPFKTGESLKYINEGYVGSRMEHAYPDPTKQ